MRRRDLLRLAAASGAAGTVWATPGRVSAQGAPAVDLAIERARIAIDGDPFAAISVAGSVPGPILRWREGREAVVRVENRLDEPTSIHWHGILLAGGMDGSPGFNGFAEIPPGETFTYRFALRQAGTYWYHSHSAGQEQLGLYGAIVVEPAGGERIKADRDHVVVLSDHAAEHPATILRRLKASPDIYARPRTVGDLLRDAARDGLGAALADRAEWGAMRMPPNDLSDVSGYRFLVNGKGPGDNWTALFAPGERVRLRFVNASAMTFFDVRVPGLRMTVVAADGQDVLPVPVDEFRIGIGETYDVIVQPKEARAYAIAAEPLDRTGMALATLAPRAGMRAEAPAPKPRAVLAMEDMGHGIGGGHAGHATPTVAAADPHAGHGAPASTNPHAGHGAPAAADPHAAHGAAAPAVDPERPVGWAATGADPGAKILSYTDLKAFVPRRAPAPPTRELRLVLGGQMGRYIWTLNGRRFDQDEPIRAAFGERIRITYANATMMAHPMHLHGMFVELDNGQTERRPRKHVTIVPPGKELSVLLTADEPGDWPFHCHLLYHMEAGMMTRFVVDPPKGRPA